MAGDGRRGEWWRVGGGGMWSTNFGFLWPAIIKHLSIFEKCCLFGSRHLNGIVWLAVAFFMKWIDLIFHLLPLFSALNGTFTARQPSVSWLPVPLFIYVILIENSDRTAAKWCHFVDTWPYTSPLESLSPCSNPIGIFWRIFLFI